MSQEKIYFFILSKTTPVISKTNPLRVNRPKICDQWGLKMKMPKRTRETLANKGFIVKYALFFCEIRQDRRLDPRRHF
jgi:hypothetical protein